MKIKYKKLSSEIVHPTQPIPGNSGWDVRASTKLIINAYKTIRAGTGLSVEVPKGYEIQVRGRSNIAVEKGLTISQGIGTIEQGFTGEIQVFLRNMEPYTKVIEPGEIIAQIVVKEVPEIEWVETPKLAKVEERKKEMPKTTETKTTEVKEEKRV